MTKITVFGTGSFGTALANVLAENGHSVLMWGKNENTVDEINQSHQNKRLSLIHISEPTRRS